MQDPVPGNVVRARTIIRPVASAPLAATTDSTERFQYRHGWRDRHLPYQYDKSAKVQADIAREIVALSRARPPRRDDKPRGDDPGRHRRFAAGDAGYGQEAAHCRHRREQYPGFLYRPDAAYPRVAAVAEKKGIDAEVTNAGVPFDTTAAMLTRIDRDVPKGTDIVILQPGANDRRFFIGREQRAANLARWSAAAREVRSWSMTRRSVALLRLRLHSSTREGHAMIAAALLHGSWRCRARAGDAASSPLILPLSFPADRYRFPIGGSSMAEDRKAKLAGVNHWDELIAMRDRQREEKRDARRWSGSELPLEVSRQGLMRSICIPRSRTRRFPPTCSSSRRSARQPLRPAEIPGQPGER